MATMAAPVPATLPTTGEYKSGIWSWLTTVDHKRIGILYLVSALFFFCWGGLEAVIIRAQLSAPNLALVTAQQYNQLFTMHGTTMVFLVIMPLSSAFFNFLIPLQIGARDVAFPRLNAFSYWVFLAGGIVVTLPILFGMAPDGGWFGYAPLTTKAYSSGYNIDYWVIGLQILGVASLAAAFNFITTIINLRAPGMVLMRMPVFTWMSFVVQFLVVLAFPVITAALVFLIFDRFFDTNFYTIAEGADPLLWQHLFWVFGHPEVYILILPAFGLVSEVLPTFSRKPLFGYPVIVYSGILIGAMGFGVWAHHMFSVGMGPIADSVFSVTTMLIAIPTGVKILNWVSTMWGGQIRFTTSMMFAISLVAMFTVGGISGIMHSSAPADLQQTDSYFVVAHFHYVLVGGAVLGIMAGIYYYFPKMTGRMLDETLGKWHFWIFVIGTNLTFFPMHMSGLYGMPRRIYTYDAGQGWEIYNQLSSIGALLQLIGMTIFVVNFIRSWKKGAIAGNNPWGAPTLEWALPSPVPDYNFAHIPIVTSRYPLWDQKADELVKSEAETTVDGRLKTAKELGIPMPFPTILPLVAAAFMTAMLCGLLFIHAGNLPLALTIMITCGLGLAFTLIKWLTSPLE